VGLNLERHPDRSNAMTYLFLTLSALNFAVAAVASSLPNLAAGSSLLLLACVWACGEAGEVEYDTDEA
jgi:hypothetical protein